MSVFKYFAKIDVKHVPDASGGVQYRGPKAKATKVEARVALICASTSPCSTPASAEPIFKTDCAN